jgi:diguanylate cyclase (GGDEF)-like protein
VKVKYPKFLKLVIYSLLTIISVLFLRSYFLYQDMKSEILIEAKREAHLLKDYMMSMREVYQQQFLKSGIELNDKTLGFLPAHASALISDIFLLKNKENFYIRNVSDNPRNKKNMADEVELMAIEFFKNDSSKAEYFEKHKDLKGEYFQYAKPIYIESSCLVCHGNKEETMTVIRDNYDTAYNYKVGDIRGIVSIKIPHSNIKEKVYKYFEKEAAFALVTFLLIGIIISIIYRRVIFQINNIETKAINLASTDALTGLYNRHYLERVDLDLNSGYYQMSDEKFVVAFFDIDKFKSVNDSYGHDMGDEVLKEFAKILKKLTRREDVVCRYGGEEFLLIVKNISSNKAIQKFENIRKKIENKIIISNNKSIQITVSAGVAIGTENDSLENVITKADAALYKAKANGRNCIEVF